MALQDEKTLYVVVAGEPSEPEDAGVAGIYEMGVAGHLTEGQQFEAALDQFHDHVGIGMLDDFRIEVMNPDGTALEGIEEYENGQLAGFAQFYGSVDVGQAPAAVAAAFEQSAAKPAR